MRTLVHVCALWCMYVHSGACMRTVVHVCALWCMYAHSGACVRTVVHVCALWCMYAHCGACMRTVVHVCALWCMCAQDGFTALTLAAKDGFIEIVNMLLQKEAYVNLPDRVSSSVCLSLSPSTQPELLHLSVNTGRAAPPICQMGGAPPSISPFLNQTGRAAPSNSMETWAYSTKLF